MAVARRPLGEDFAVKIIEGRKKRDGAVTAIVVRAGVDVTLAERQTGWRALPRLTLTLRVAAQHDGTGRRIQIEANHVPELFLEMGIVRQWESTGAVRLDVIRAPQSLHGILGQSHMTSHLAA